MLAKSSKKYILNRINNAFIISIFIDFGHCPLPLRNVLYTKCPTFVYFVLRKHIKCPFKLREECN